MAKLTIADLKKIKEKQQATFNLREGGYRAKVTVHMGTCGIAAGAREIMTALMDEIDTMTRQTVLLSKLPLEMQDLMSQIGSREFRDERNVMKGKSPARYSAPENTTMPWLTGASLGSNCTKKGRLG